ncbi:pyridoxal phosphate-dependent aminotransferase [Sulfuricurvum sp. RIFCSPLOWO2_12_FULL_43_24]|uniref:pyridoxal phosphate-dependent aminotransferase n=1 Tax=Sulfuricurvum sp. RIFCSPLOWO2_12_FULL_43_24 TaxID=1802247 RepID=UPI0008D865C6|nr:pyridoxal phosphate-dependent aminotransferase [Sulfuricurvum sp. RIFCSPLOWO2_12_FULL_43_24]OHD89372.1 MAG: aspartate aminotransferase [Sulfuricurvum sp. RIFCSPLOWO2_12_FULL_43_24]OHD92544.1 MAG: aspartate aminotransferase [Sulfuricurvum sp. RIFCSPLOWO2_12_43_5]
MLTDRVNILSESITIAISTLAQELKAQGKNILSFSAGEPDFDTPQVIKDAAIKAINDGFTKYTAVDGIPDLKAAIALKLKRDNGLEYKPNQIIANNGAKHSLYNLFACTIQAGDEVIIPAPYWVTYPELVMYCGGTVVEIMTDDASGFKITPEQLKAALTPKTKMLILTSPSNPTGAVYSQEELTALGKVLEGTNIIVASDEMYEKLIYDGEFTSAAAVSDDMFQRTVTINGLSKSVAMTGWRFGYMAAANTEIIQATKKLQSQSTSNINSITQKAAIVGLNGDADADIEAMRVQFKARRDEAVKLFNEVDGLSVLSPAGAFYLFVNIKEVSNDSMQFCKELLEEQGIAVVPGVGFGSEGYFRFSFATDIESIREGIKRIATFVANKK